MNNCGIKTHKLYENLNKKKMPTLLKKSYGGEEWNLERKNFELEALKMRTAEVMAEYFTLPVLPDL